MVSQPDKWEMRSWVQSSVPPPWVHTWPSPPMKREMKGSLPAREMGDEVLGSIPSFSPWVHTVALLDNKTGVEGWSPNPKMEDEVLGSIPSASPLNPP